MINSHDANILFPKNSTEQRTCNCINKVIKIKQSSNQNYQQKVCFGSCETTFNKEFSNHKKSFNLYEYKNKTKLSNEIWRIKIRAITQKLNGE